MAIVLIVLKTNGIFVMKGLALRVLAPENLLTVKSKWTKALIM